MSNILTIPASGSIYFSNDAARSSVPPSLTTSVSLSYDGGGGVNIASLSPSVNRFTVNGNKGRLLTITDNLVGNVLTVNGDVSATNVIFASGGNSNLWNLAYTTVGSNSGKWEGVYTTVQGNSGRWEGV